MSPLLADLKKRSNTHEALPQLDSINMSHQSPTFILNTNYSIYLMNSLVKLIHQLNQGKQIFLNGFNCLSKNMDALKNYFENLSQRLNDTLKKNWFLRNEIHFVLNCFKCSLVQTHFDKRVAQAVAFNLVCYLTADRIADAMYIFDNVIFNIEEYENKLKCSKVSLLQWREVYRIICMYPFLNEVSIIHKRNKSTL